MKRLTPSLVACVWFTALTLALVVPPNTRGVREFFVSGMLSLCGSSNIYFSVLLSEVYNLPQTSASNSSQGEQRSGNDAAGYFIEWDEEDEQDLISAGASLPHDVQKNPFMHTWSLGVEEQWYLVFPPIVLLLYHRSALVSPFWGWSMLIVISLVISVVLTKYENTHAFYMMPSRVWELASGSILYEWQRQVELAESPPPASTSASLSHPTASPPSSLDATKKPSVSAEDDANAEPVAPPTYGHEGTTPRTLFRRLLASPLVVAALDAAALGSLCSALILTKPGHLFPVPWAILTVFGTLCFIFAGMSPPHTLMTSPMTVQLPLFNRCLAHRILAYCGRLSYPFYLWHWPVIVFFRWLGLTSAGFMVLSAVPSMLFTLLSFHGPEAHARAWRPRHASEHDPWVYATSLSASGLTAGWVALLGWVLHAQLCVRDDTFDVNSAECDASTDEIEDVFVRRFGSGANSDESPQPTWISCEAVPTEPSPSSPARCPDPRSGNGSASRALGGRTWWYSLANVEARSCSCTVCPCTPALHVNVNRSIGKVGGGGDGTPCFVNADPNNPTLQGKSPYTEADLSAWQLSLCTLVTGSSDAMRNIEYCLQPARSPFLYRAAFVVGDSHAAMYVPAVAAAVKGYAEVRHLTVGHMCGFNSKAFHCKMSQLADIPLERCSRAQADVWKALNRFLEPGDLLFTITAHLKYAQRSIPVAPFNFDSEHLLAAYNLAHSRGASFILLGDGPTLRVVPNDTLLPGHSMSSVHCLNDTIRRTECTVAMADMPLWSAAQSYFETMTNDRPGAYYFPVLPLFCDDDGLCDGTIPGTMPITMALEDVQGHWSFEGAMYVAPFLACFLESNGLLGCVAPEDESSQLIFLLLLLLLLLVPSFYIFRKCCKQRVTRTHGDEVCNDATSATSQGDGATVTPETWM